MKKSVRSGVRIKRSATSTIEQLELRTFFSFTPIHGPLFPITNPTNSTTGSTAPSGGYSVAQIRGAYGLGQYNAANVTFGGIQGDGSGQTIAVIEENNDPNVVADLHTFDLAEGLPDTTVTVLNQYGNNPTQNPVYNPGQTTALPANDPQTPSSSSDWAGEETLDVEWAHAIAPGANIDVFESANNLFVCDQTAIAYPNVSVISNSWEYTSEITNEAQYDSYYIAATNHQGVTSLASTGDTGSQVGYIATSPNVVAVGGTQLTVTLGTTNWQSETAWTYGGGGTSAQEKQPTFQAGTLPSATYRETPDISMVAGENSGNRTSYAPVSDSWDYGVGTSWVGEQGTSWSSPLTAGLVAVADQGRASESLGTLSSGQTLTRLYQLAAANFHDITTGSNGHAATTGYDLATGRGAPIANLLIPDLAGAATITGRAFVDLQGNGVYGGSDTPVSGQSVYLDLNNDGVLDNGEPSTTTDANGLYTFSDQPAGGTIRLTSAAPSGLTLTSASTAAIVYGATETNNFVYSATPSKVAFTQQPPSSSTFGTALSPLTVNVESTGGLTVGTDSSTVTLTLSQGTFSTGLATATASAVNGVATFAGLQLSSVGTYTLTASDAALSTAVSSSFTITQATPTINWSNPADIAYPTPLSTTQLNATASVAGSFLYSPGIGTVLNAGTNQTLSATFTPTDTVDYTQASASVSINVTGVTSSPISLSGNTFYVQLVGSNVDIWTTGTPTGTPAVSQAYNSITSITLSGVSAGDNFTADFSGGSVIPTGGLTFNGFGSAASNELTVVGTKGSDSVTVPGDGTYNINSLTVSYSTSTIGKTYFVSPGIGEALTVPSGAVTIAPGSASGITDEVFTSLTVGANASLVVPVAPSQAQRVLLQTGSLSLAGTSSNWTSTLNLSSNDLAVTGGSLSDITSQVAQGFTTGTGGIISSVAAADPSHLTNLGVILNNADGSTPLYGSAGALGLFDGASPSASAVLVKYTYFGDANVTGVVDGSDYSLIDSGLLTAANGWFNGDFNYDGVINGSDYTLIDNAFNTQGASLAAQVVSSSTTPSARNTAIFDQTAIGLSSQISIEPTASVADQIFSTDSDNLITRVKFSDQQILG